MFFRIVAQAHEIQVVFWDLLKAFDHPRLLVPIVVGQQALLIGLAVVLIFKGMEETVYILGQGKDGRRFPVRRDIETVQFYMLRFPSGARLI
jgi:hypothetical protein